MLPGDCIVAVDSVAITGVRADVIIRRMRGPAGTKVRSTLRRERGTGSRNRFTVSHLAVACGGRYELDGLDGTPITAPAGGGPTSQSGGATSVTVPVPEAKAT